MTGRSTISLIAGLAAAIIFVVLSIFVISRFIGNFHSPYFYVPAFFAILMIPAGYSRTAYRANIRETDSRLHDLLRDLSDYVMFGVPLSEGFRRVASNNYGPLNKEIESVIRKLDSALPIEDALSGFGDLSGSMNAKRVGNLLRESSKSGSNSSDVIALISEFMSQIEIFRYQTENERKNYDLILIISFAVFLIVIVIIEVSFFNAISPSGGSGIFLAHPDVKAIKAALDLGLYVEAAGIAITIGVVRDRNPLSGFLEGGFMLLISTLMLAFLGGF